jgi:hypothetical protein
MPKPLRGRASHTPQAKVERADDTARALNMTRSGMTVRAIAKVLDCSPARVHALVKAARLAIPEAERSMLVAEIHERELGIISKHWPRRFEPDSAKLIQASDKILMDLFGLAAPKRTELSGPNGGPVQTIDLSKLTDEQLDRQLERLAIEAAGDGEGGEGS